jgi:copper resistance protein B
MRGALGIALMLASAQLGLSATPAMAQMSGMMANEAAPFGPPIHDNRIWVHGVLDQLEGRFGDGAARLRWQGEVWAGTDMNRIKIRSEGEWSRQGKIEDGQQEVFYSRPVSTYFDALIGARYDLDSGPGRGWAAFGIEALAPLFFHVSATAYVSEKGRAAAKLEGSYDLLITQRLILQPQLEMNLYATDDPARHIGSGLSDLDAGLRLRYEISRKFAPYIGITYEKKFGRTARFVEAEGEQSDGVHVTVGLRLWI